MSRVVTLTQVKNQSNNRQILTNTATDDDIDTEQVTLPKRELNAVLQRKDENYKHCLQDVISKSALAAAERQKKEIYITALEKEKKKNEEIERRNQILEKELDTYKSKNKTNPQAKQLLKKWDENDLIKNKDALIQEEAKKYVKEIEELRIKLGLN